MGVVGVALRGLTAGKGGKGQSWAISSGDGGWEGRGAVALLRGIVNDGWRGLLGDSGEGLRELVEVPFGAYRSARRYDWSKKNH